MPDVTTKNLGLVQQAAGTKYDINVVNENLQKIDDAFSVGVDKFAPTERLQKVFTRDSNRRITKVEYKDGSTIVLTKTLTRDSVTNRISTVIVTDGVVTVTGTIIRDTDGKYIRIDEVVS